jgi:hypothetical protein
MDSLSILSFVLYSDYVDVPGSKKFAEKRLIFRPHFLEKRNSRKRIRNS